MQLVRKIEDLLRKNKYCYMTQKENEDGLITMEWVTGE